MASLRNEPPSVSGGVEADDDDSAPRIFSPAYYARMRALEQASCSNAGMRDVAGSLLRKARLPASGLLVDVRCGSGRRCGGGPGRLKVGWLRLEGAGLGAGRQLPFGRTIFALCRLRLTARP